MDESLTPTTRKASKAEETIALLLYLQCLQPYLRTQDWIALRSVSHMLYLDSDDVLFRYLLPHQKTHFYDMRTILRCYGCALDSSATGRGKSYVTCALARSLHLTLTIIAPNSAVQNWKDALEHFNITGAALNQQPTVAQAGIFTYSWFNSRTPPFILRPKLTKTLDGQIPPDRNAKPVATDSWMPRVRAGTLLVFDESHFLKNTSKRSAACAVLVKTLREHGPKSRVLLNSATAYDNVNQATRLMRLFGILTQKSLVTYITGHPRWTGMRQVFTFCDRIPGATEEIDLWMDRFNPPRFMGENNCNSINNRLLTTHVKSAIIRAMRAPETILEPSYATLFYDQQSTLHAQTLMRKGCSSISRGLAILQTTPSRASEALTLIGTGLRSIEAGKIDCFVLVAQMVLQHDPQSKVILMLNYLHPIAMAGNALQRYNPLVLTGSVTPSKRRDLVSLFQQPNNDFRLIIANTTVVSNGLDLDDKIGDRPRTLFLSPSYYISKLHQAAGRVWRCNTKSAPVIRFLFHTQIRQEVRLLESLARKATTLKKLCPYDVKFPGQHDVKILSSEDYYKAYGRA